MSNQSRYKSNKLSKFPTGEIFEQQFIEHLLIERPLSKKSGLAGEELIVGESFEVSLSKIDPRLFLAKRRDVFEEKVRQLIEGALATAYANPETYMLFYFFVAKTTDVFGDNESMTLDELISYPQKIGGCIASDIHFLLALAMRICNGESWDSVCHTNVIEGVILCSHASDFFYRYKKFYAPRCPNGTFNCSYGRQDCGGLCAFRDMITTDTCYRDAIPLIIFSHKE